MIKKFKSLLTLAIIAGVSTTASAQSYYDDDIYYDAEKARKERAEKKLNQAKQKENNRNHSLYGSPLPGSDSYHVYTDNNRDVDEYNRRNQSHSHIDSSAVDGQTGDFAYTRRIERFYNPDVVAGSNDNDLKEYYYESQVENPSTTINLIVQPDYGWYSPYYYTSWRNPWYTPAWGWYDPWYSPAWGPSFSFSWGWGPSWGWAPPHHHYRPATGGMVTNRPGYAGSNRRYISGNRRVNNSGNRTPSYNGRRPSGVNNNSYNGNFGGNRRGAATNRNSGNNRPRQYDNSNHNNNSSWGTSGNNRGSSFGSGGSFGGGGRGSAGRGGGGNRRR